MRVPSGDQAGSSEADSDQCGFERCSHVLIAEPRGAERFGLGDIAAAVDDLAVAESENLPGPVLDHRSGILPVAPLVKPDQDRVSCVDQLFGLEAEIVEGSRPLMEETAHLL